MDLLRKTDGDEDAFSQILQDTVSQYCKVGEEEGEEEEGDDDDDDDDDDDEKGRRGGGGGGCGC